jgi:hypothetical protein
MSPEWIDWVIAYLEKDEEIIVPVKKMWNGWREGHDAPDFELFTSTVLEDPRVEFVDEIDHASGLNWGTSDEREAYLVDMEGLGYYSGKRVKLVSRKLTSQHLALMLAKQVKRMESALLAARESMPAGMGEDEEGQLIDILGKVEELQRSIQEIGLNLSKDEGKQKGTGSQ